MGMLPSTGFAVMFLGTAVLDNVLYLNVMVHTLNHCMLHFWCAVAHEPSSLIALIFI